MSGVYPSLPCSALGEVVGWEVPYLRMLRVACSGCRYRMQTQTSCSEWSQAARLPKWDDSASSLSQRLMAICLPSE